MFKELLKRILQQVEGSLGIIIIGLDGIPIEQVSFSSDIDLEQVGAEISSLIKSTIQTTTRSELGGLLETTILTDKARFIARLITHEYFILLGLAPDGNYGRARYELKKAQVILESEFVI